MTSQLGTIIVLLVIGTTFLIGCWALLAVIAYRLFTIRNYVIAMHDAQALDRAERKRAESSARMRPGGTP